MLQASGTNREIAIASSFIGRRAEGKTGALEIFLGWPRKVEIVVDAMERLALQEGSARHSQNYF